MPASDSLGDREGLTTIPSRCDPKETMDRLEAEIRSEGLAIFAQIDHAVGAVEAGLTLRPTNLIIFGNARGGTPLMQSVQTVGIDLPLKALVWQDAGGKLGFLTTSRVGSRNGMASRRPTPLSAK